MQVYVDGMTTVSTFERRASIREFYGAQSELKFFVVLQILELPSFPYMCVYRHTVCSLEPNLQLLYIPPFDNSKATWSKEHDLRRAELKR